MDILKLWVVIAFAISPASSFACKELVKYPEHLQVSGQDRNYYVVEISEAKGDGFTGIVKKEFADQNLIEKKVIIEFKKGEEAHAICPISILPGQTYLLRSDTISEPLQISRYNWLNVSSTHPKFNTYVDDLEAVRASK